MPGLTRALAPAVLLAALACDPTSILMTPGYQLTSIPRQARLAIVLPTRIEVDYTGDVTNEFGQGDPETLIGQFFRTNIQQYAQSHTLCRVEMCRALPNEIFTGTTVLELRGSDDVTIKMPADGSRLPCGATPADFVLILSDIAVNSSLDISASPGGRNQAAFFSAEKNLVIQAAFVLWDNTQATMMAHGFVRAVDENAFAVSMEDWEAAMGTFALLLFAKTPLYTSVADSAAY